MENVCKVTDEYGVYYERLVVMHTPRIDWSDGEKERDRTIESLSVTLPLKYNFREIIGECQVEAREDGLYGTAMLRESE